MAGICFYFENNDIDVWSGRLIDLDAWNYACKMNPDITKAVIINQTNIDLHSFDADMDITIVSEPIPLEGNIVQLICPWEQPNSISLWDYHHNVDWYCYGPGAGWTDNYFANDYVYIPQNSRVACHSIHIHTVTMAHRYKTLHI